MSLQANPVSAMLPSQTPNPNLPTPQNNAALGKETTKSIFIPGMHIPDEIMCLFQMPVDYVCSDGGPDLPNPDSRNQSALPNSAHEEARSY